jgi:hypothetical protein
LILSFGTGKKNLKYSVIMKIWRNIETYYGRAEKGRGNFLQGAFANHFNNLINIVT